MSIKKKVLFSRILLMYCNFQTRKDNFIRDIIIQILIMFKFVEWCAQRGTNFF